MTEKTRRRLQSRMWYHGTTIQGYRNIIEHGVIVDYNKGHELDFGYGFYLTDSQNSAENYLKRLYECSENLVVMEFDFCPLECDENYTIKTFEHFDREFAEFVFENRNLCNTNKAPMFDIIYGVMTDSAPTQLMLQYKAGDIDKETVLQGFQKSTSVKQLSIHRQEICNMLGFRRAYLYIPNIENAEKDIRKELTSDE